MASGTYLECTFLNIFAILPLPSLASAGSGPRFLPPVHSWGGCLQCALCCMCCKDCVCLDSLVHDALCLTVTLCWTVILGPRTWATRTPLLALFRIPCLGCLCLFIPSLFLLPRVPVVILPYIHVAPPLIIHNEAACGV